MKRLFSNLIIFLSALAAVSCADDRMWADDGVIGEGEADIKATIGYKSFDPALESRISGGSDGTILDNLESFTVLIYNQDGTTLIDRKDYAKGSFETTTNTQKPADGEDVEQSSTPKTTFNLTLPYGKYKAYIVGNASLKDKDGKDLDVSNETALQNITCEWQDNIADNNQMFGWFSSDAAGAIKANTFTDGRMVAPVLTINKPGMTLTAWLVRLASKVTIAYDASNLKENVFIFLKSVTIKDIPKTCALGVSNTPTSKEQLTNGQSIIYYEGKEPTVSADFNAETYPAMLSTADNEPFGSSHAHNDQHALFFYENNQGTGKDKRQDAVTNTTIPGDQIGSDSDFNEGSGPSDGQIDFPDGNSEDSNTGFKDEKRFGTYIEVEAYYRSNNAERLGEGKIIYRFMLGQDVLKNYDAKRNYHYKLTLKFNGFANDVDWHIDYEQEPDIYIPAPYYISYLYDKSMELPVQIIGKIQPGTTLKAEIIENNWQPFIYQNEDPQAELDLLNEYYNPQNADLTGTMKPTAQEYATTQKKPWFGFLSLTNPGSRTQVQMPDGANYETVLKNYWDTNKQGEREYQYTSTDDYTVEDKGEDIKVFSIPMFTRPKNLVKTSGYTGNNPYVSYQRKAVVRFTASIWNPLTEKYEQKHKDVDIIQVRRIVNPKGIWRDWNETASFDVHLMHLESEYTRNPWAADKSFESFESIGPWSAEVLVQGQDDGSGVNSPTDWIQLDPLGDATKKDGVIYGETGSTIDFRYTPKGSTGGADKVRYGIIKVRYHNYTCEHLIFVRQGYAPIRVVSGGKKWYSFNMNSRSEMASSPCDEGSLFKRFRWDYPISSLNNKEISFMVNPSSGLKLWSKDGNGATVKWTDWYAPLITNAKPFEDKSKWQNPTVEGENMKIAEVEDYLALYNNNDVQQGYGVLYDGNANDVQTSLKDAYSYYSDYTKGANGNGCGMRGCFVYNEKTGAQIFLPIGAAGYGRRRGFNRYWIGHDGYPGPFYAGMLTYGSRNEFMPASAGQNMPLLFDLFRRPGAIYWTNQTMQEVAIPTDEKTEASVGWDFNYITFDFYPIAMYNVIEITSDANQVGRVTDALRVRCVVDE